MNALASLAFLGLALHACALRCPENEHLPDCVPCTEKCSEDLGLCEQEGLPCEPPRRCYCKPGFARTLSGRCVLRKRCRKVPSNKDVTIFPPAQYVECPENEELPKCIPCGENCSADRNFCFLKFFPCFKPGQCHCKPGHLRNLTGHCVPSHQCGSAPWQPLECKRTHEIIPDCVPCRVTCEDLDKKRCPQACVEPTQCFCKRGYLRAPNGKCVKKSTCARYRNLDGDN